MPEKYRATILWKKQGEESCAVSHHVREGTLRRMVELKRAAAR